MLEDFAEELSLAFSNEFLKKKVHRNSWGNSRKKNTRGIPGGFLEDLPEYSTYELLEKFSEDLMQEFPK